MKTVEVSASGRYDIFIENGLLDKCGKMIGNIIPPCRVAVITDDVVDSLYGERTVSSLEDAGFKPCKYAFPNGEKSKNPDIWLKILNFFSESEITANDLIIALGGGVVGDMAGFAAATFLRGVPFVQIPTTYLAMIDSSVGGKTAIDLPSGKNLAGAFYQPKMVICDTSVLSTLPDAVFADGTAEAIKYGVLANKMLFETIASGDFRDGIEEIIEKCVKIKAKVVAEDEFDKGLRQTLNLGHTVGHAVEKCSEYGITHGHAVAIGMSVISSAADRLCWSDEKCGDAIKAALRQNNLPMTCDFSSIELSKVIASDKKRIGGNINLIIPKRIGKCEIRTVKLEEVEKIVRAGLGE